MNRKLFFSFLLAGAVMLPTCLNAQAAKKIRGTLTGTVIGLNGKPIANAAVSCESSGGFSPHAIHTDSHGKFVITGLKTDSYDLRASSKGANSEWYRNIPVRSGQTKDVTLQLLTTQLTTSPAAVKQREASPQ